MPREVIYSYATGRCLRLTDKAALIDFGDQEAWVPLSVLDADTIDTLDPEDETMHDVYVADWWAKKNI